MTATALLFSLALPLSALGDPPGPAHPAPPAAQTAEAALPSRPPSAARADAAATATATAPSPVPTGQERRGAERAQAPLAAPPSDSPPAADDGDDGADDADAGADETAAEAASPPAPVTPAQQARRAAATFLTHLVRGNVKALLSVSGLPFMLEGRRLERPEQLTAEWSRLLMQRRTDLFTLYDVEVLEPAEMLRRHGRPPPRLAGWALDAPGMLLAVGNLSGHPVVLLVRPIGRHWAVVGFHD